MMSRYKPVLETTYAYMPKNRAQVSQELGGWRTERSSEGHASHAIERVCSTAEGNGQNLILVKVFVHFQFSFLSLFFFFPVSLKRIFSFEALGSG